MYDHLSYCKRENYIIIRIKYRIKHLLVSITLETLSYSTHMDNSY